MTTVETYRDEIRPDRVDPQHRVDAARVAAIVAHVRAAGTWSLPPVLVLEDEGNGHAILDGHHRCAAAAALLASDDDAPRPTSIPAYVVPLAELARVLAAHFGDAIPARLADLDDYLQVDGAPYVRGAEGQP